MCVEPLSHTCGLMNDSHVRQALTSRLVDICKTRGRRDVEVTSETSSSPFPGKMETTSELASTSWDASLEADEGHAEEKI